MATSGTPGKFADSLRSAVSAAGDAGAPQPAHSSLGASGASGDAAPAPPSPAPLQRAFSRGTPLPVPNTASEDVTDGSGLHFGHVTPEALLAADVPLDRAELQHRAALAQGALHEACTMGKVQHVSRLLQAIAALRRAVEGLEAPSASAAVTAVELTLDRSAVTPEDVDSMHMEQGWNPLHVAARNGHADVVQELLQHGASVNVANTVSRSSPCVLACKYGHVEVVRHLVKGGDCELDKPDKYGRTPVLLAAERGFLDLAGLLVQAGADVNYNSRKHGTPLLRAARSLGVGNADMVRLLLEAGADPNVQRRDRGLRALTAAVPLGAAVLVGNLEVVKALVAARADVHVRLAREPGDSERLPKTLMDVAAEKGHAHIVEYLATTHRVPVNASALMARAGGPTWGSPLMRAAKGGHVAAVTVLLGLGADTATANVKGVTALHLAARAGSTAAVQVLLRVIGERAADKAVAAAKASAGAAGAQELTALAQAAADDAIAEAVNVEDVNGATPLMFATAGATRETETALVETLLDAGADVNDADTKTHGTVLMAAVVNCSTDIVRLLIERGAAVDTARSMDTSDGWTALHWAASLSRHDVATLLVDAGADLGVRDSAGHTPSDVAGDATLRLITMPLGQEVSFADLHPASCEWVAMLEGGGGGGGGAQWHGGRGSSDGVQWGTVQQATGSDLVKLLQALYLKLGAGWPRALRHIAPQVSEVTAGTAGLSAPPPALRMPERYATLQWQPGQGSSVVGADTAASAEEGRAAHAASPWMESSYCTACEEEEEEGGGGGGATPLPPAFADDYDDVPQAAPPSMDRPKVTVPRHPPRQSPPLGTPASTSSWQPREAAPSPSTRPALGLPSAHGAMTPQPALSTPWRAGNAQLLAHQQAAQQQQAAAAQAAAMAAVQAIAAQNAAFMQSALAALGGGMWGMGGGMGAPWGAPPPMALPGGWGAPSPHTGPQFHHPGAAPHHCNTFHQGGGQVQSASGSGSVYTLDSCPAPLPPQPEVETADADPAEGETDAAGGGEDVVPGSVPTKAIVGQGSHGIVWAGLWHGTPVAVKELAPPSSEDEGVAGREGGDPVASMQREIRMLRSIQASPLITTCYGLTRRAQSVYAVMELAPGVTLRDLLLHAGGAAFFSLRHRVEIAHSLLQAIIHMHRESIAHRDLHGGNVIVTASNATQPRGVELQVRIIDFGLAVQVDAEADDEASRRAAARLYKGLTLPRTLRLLPSAGKVPARAGSPQRRGHVRTPTGRGAVVIPSATQAAKGKKGPPRLQHSTSTPSFWLEGSRRGLSGGSKSAAAPAQGSQQDTAGLARGAADADTGGFSETLPHQTGGGQGTAPGGAGQTRQAGLRWGGRGGHRPSASVSTLPSLAAHAQSSGEAWRSTSLNAEGQAPARRVSFDGPGAVQEESSTPLQPGSQELPARDEWAAERDVMGVACLITWLLLGKGAGDFSLAKWEALPSKDKCSFADFLSPLWRVSSGLAPLPPAADAPDAPFAGNIPRLPSAGADAVRALLQGARLAMPGALASTKAGAKPRRTSAYLRVAAGAVMAAQEMAALGGMTSGTAPSTQSASRGAAHGVVPSGDGAGNAPPTVRAAVRAQACLRRLLEQAGEDSAPASAQAGAASASKAP